MEPLVEADEGPALGRKTRLLLIDDNPIFCRSTERFLNRFQDLEVMATAASGDAGLAKARELEPDIVLVDLNMPGMPGLEVIRRLGATVPRADVIVLTLMDTQNHRRAAERAGAKGYIVKTRLVNDLVPMIRILAANRNSPS